MSSPTLESILLTDDTRPRVIDACVRVIGEEVASKRGVGGLAIKGAFKMVKTVKPTIIRDSVEGLLPDFVARIEPFYEKHCSEKQAAGGGDWAAYLERNADDAAEALLGITDDRARKASNRVLVKAYQKLRPKGKAHVVAAMPRIGRMLAQNGA